MNINISLNVDEINAVLQTLGQLPTSSGAWPLLLKIKEQADSQINATTALEPQE